MGTFLFRSQNRTAPTKVENKTTVKSEPKQEVKPTVKTEPAKFEKGGEIKKEGIQLPVEKKPFVMCANKGTLAEAKEIKDSIPGAIIRDGAKGRFLVYKPK